jgi:hypothetical protein
MNDFRTPFPADETDDESAFVAPSRDPFSVIGHTFGRTWVRQCHTGTTT